MNDVTMTGAEALVQTLEAAGVERCFTNPGTSEMHAVAAIGRAEKMRASLCLFEGVATGAADGYDARSEDGANYSRLVSDRRVDPVAGSQPLRSGLCEIEPLSSSG